MPPPTVHGWFSLKQSFVTGKTFMYKRSGTDEDVVLTMVNRSDTNHDTNWDDMVYVGTVDRFIRKIYTGRQ